MIDIKEIHNKQYKNIFFDIFDTIVSRTVQPEYTKKIWANHIVKRCKLNISMIDLYQKRNRLEASIGEKNANEGHDWEFCYQDLLTELYQEIETDISLEEFSKIATEIEVEIESNVQKVDDKVLKEIKRAKKEGKKIYCISDMYLSKEMITEIFNNLEILEYFDDIFISCEYLKNKKSGELYSIVLKKLKAKPEECIMIGDNEHSDFTMPKEKGMEALHLDRSKNYKKYEKFEQENTPELTLEKVEKLTEKNSDNFENIIFSLYNFTEKLYYQLLDDGLDEVFFLSREGEYLKKLFDEFQKNIYGKKLKTNYLLVSRKATYLPSLKSLDKEDFAGLLQQYSYINLKEFLASLNFSKEDIQSILDSYRKDCQKIIEKEELNENEEREMKEIIDGNYDQKIIYLYESKLLIFLKENKTFKEIYEQNRTEQNELFKKYIHSMTKEKRICVVDVGWNGSIQDNIANILGSEYTVTGYLLGLVTREDPKKVAKLNNKQGLIFTNVPEVSKNFDLYAENRSVYEILLGASHGSANRYVEKGSKVEVLTFEKKEEKDIYKNVISKIQDTMMETFKELLKIIPNGYYDNKKLEKIFNRAHFKMLFLPNEEQLKFYNKIYHYENFGVFEFTEFNLKKKLSIKYYLKENLKYFIKHKAFFYDAFWPVLKLCNEKLYLQKALYVHGRKRSLKRKGVL